MSTHSLPQLITFDGEARSGKGTIAHFLKRELSSSGLSVMLIDRGQAFRGLVVSATRHDVDMDNPAALDIFLSDRRMLDETAQLLKNIYAMSHEERDALLYTPEVSEASAKVGARPLSQDFVHDLTLKWLADAATERTEVILMDGRALEEISLEAEEKGLVRYIAELYFICDPVVGARRTLGFAGRTDDELTVDERRAVQTFTAQIVERNRKDAERSSQPLRRPEDAIMLSLPDSPPLSVADTRLVAVIDTGADMTKAAMSEPVLALVRQRLA